MSIIDTLVTDRTAADLSELKSLLAIPFSQWTQEQKEQFQLAVSKGAYNASDLNRVNDACQYLASKFREYGYAVSVKLPTVEEVVVTPSRLPAGYTELAYIESTGTQYINTNFYATGATKIVVDCEVSYSSGYLKVLGSYDTSAYFSWWTNGASLEAYYGTTYKNLSVGPTGRTKLTADKNNWAADTASVSFSEATFTAASPVYIFGILNGGNYANAPMTLYSCQICDNDVLVRDYVPCIDPSGAVGLYDLVTASFYGNSGTGTFVAGAIPRELPSGYTQVDYIQSSGTQYVDTGLTVTGETSVSCDFQLTETPTETKSLFRVYSSPFGFGYYSGGYFRAWGGSTASFGSSISATDRHYVTKSATECVLDDTTLTTTAHEASTENLLLFAANNRGSVFQQISMKLYLCQIYDNGTLVRDYVPAVDASGTAGLYDMVTNAFYTNAGSGTFTVGEEISGGSTGTETTTRNYWKVGDIPQQHHMAEYLQNINNLRASLELASNTPDTPADMASLTIQEANDIEIIIFAMHTTLTRVFAAFLRSGQFTFWSGNRALPTGNTDRGRTWAELDAMGTAWANWQEATWYLLLYGNLQAEGVIE